MSAAASNGDDARTGPEHDGEDPNPLIDGVEKLRPAFPASGQPASKPFRLYPEWAQRGPFW